MYLIDIDKIKTLYNMTSDDDNYITEIAEIVESYIHNFCNVKTFEKGEYEIVLKSDNKYQEFNDIIIDNYTNITSVTEINGVVYTGIKGENYEILNKRNILFDELEKINVNKFGVAKIKIEAGYEDISKEFKDIQKAGNMLFELMHSNFKNSNDKYKVLNDITIGDISKGFDTSQMDSVAFESKKVVVIANTILKKYKNINALSN